MAPNFLTSIYEDDVNLKFRRRASSDEASLVGQLPFPG